MTRMIEELCWKTVNFAWILVWFSNGQIHVSSIAVGAKNSLELIHFKRNYHVNGPLDVKLVVAIQFFRSNVPGYTFELYLWYIFETISSRNSP